MIRKITAVALLALAGCSKACIQKDCIMHCTNATRTNKALNACTSACMSIDTETPTPAPDPESGSRATVQFQIATSTRTR